MPELQLSHIALVGARISCFSDHGITNRNELKMRRIPPLEADPALNELPESERRAIVAAQLPLWVHNIITDPEFPKRRMLLMALRRFEGELKDKKDDEVISAVMSAGFKSQTFDPLDLPSTLPMRKRCSIIAQIGVWKEAYLRLEDEISRVIVNEASAVTAWCELAKKPGHTLVEEFS